MLLVILLLPLHAFSALTLLVGQQKGHPACKTTEWWGAGMVICLKRDADLHMAQLMPMPLTVSCFSKIQIGFTFLILAHPGSPGQRAVKLNGCGLLLALDVIQPYSQLTCQTFSLQSPLAFDVIMSNSCFDCVLLSYFRACASLSHLLCVF